ncbi:hypothetical protein ANN_17513 [Periplaneta americana]|uniref:Uncharacterized protein n=1 Tax=Periplaneta americana TaxID=6978 RepID=A0ABQ8SUF9_PERAM|nr:hypothetical protein ANN_17513 [Periplaneta americana]
MGGLCESSNEPAGSLKAISKSRQMADSGLDPDPEAFCDGPLPFILCEDRYSLYLPPPPPPPPPPPSPPQEWHRYLKAEKNDSMARKHSRTAHERPTPTSWLLASRPHALAEVNNRLTRKEVSCD